MPTEQDLEEFNAYKAWKEGNWVHRGRRGQPPSKPKPTFNKESYLTDYTYSIPRSDLSSRTKTNLYKITQYYGIDWDDEAYAIPVEYQKDYIEEFRNQSRRGFPPRPAAVYRKSYMIEGTTPKGSEVIYFRREGQHTAAGQSYVYVNGVQYLVTEFIQDPATRLGGSILPEETELYTQELFEARPPKKKQLPSHVDSRIPTPEEIYIDIARKDLDWT